MSTRKINAAALHAAPMFTVFEKCKDRVTRPRARSRDNWEIFDLDSETLAPDEIADVVEVLRPDLRVTMSEPERCEDTAPEGFTDDHATLEALHAGYTLVKLPDAWGSPHYRLYVCRKAAK